MKKKLHEKNFTLKMNIRPHARKLLLGKRKEEIN